MAERELRALRDALVAQGLVEGLDFAVLGTGEPTALSSEIVVLHRDTDAWQVDYRDMGVSTALLRTEDLPEAQARLVDEAHRLAAGRGRGPRATARRPTITLAELRAQRRRDSS